MPRPRKYADKAVRICVTLSPETFAKIENHPNRSEYIEQLIRFDLASSETVRIDADLSELNEALFSLDKDRLELTRQKNALEAAKSVLARTQTNALNERLKVVEAFQHRKLTERDLIGWFESRTDKLAACDFATPKDGAMWILTKLTEG